MSDDLNIGMAAGIGAAQAAAQSQATHAATMAAIDQQRMAGHAAQADMHHSIKEMIITKRWQSYAAWLKIAGLPHQHLNLLIVL